jgi:hypothetical protein
MPSYSALHFITCYPLYEAFLHIFIASSIENSDSKIGAVIHVSFFYVAFSTGSRMVFHWVKSTKVCFSSIIYEKEGYGN